MARIDADVMPLLLQYVQKFPVPQRQNSDETDVQIEDRVRSWAIRWAQQAVFSFPGRGFGTKRADGGRPISKDGFAQQKDGKLWVWDLVTGAGTGAGKFVGDQSDAQDITGQTFVEVTPLDSLGVGSTQPDVPPSQPDTPPVSEGDFEKYTVQFIKAAAGSMDVGHQKLDEVLTLAKRADAKLGRIEDITARTSDAVFKIQAIAEQVQAALKNVPAGGSSSLLDMLAKLLNRK